MPNDRQPINLPELNGFLAMAFSGLAVIWLGGVLMVPMLFDSRPSGMYAITAYGFAITYLMYGPVYIAALIKTRMLIRENKEIEVTRTWLYFCGGIVVLLITVVLLSAAFQYIAHLTG